MTQTAPPKRTRLSRILELSLIAGLTISTLLLALENRKLKDRLEPRPTEVLKRGDRVATLELRALNDSVYTYKPKSNCTRNAVSIVVYYLPCL